MRVTRGLPSLLCVCRDAHGSSNPFLERAVDTALLAVVGVVGAASLSSLLQLAARVGVTLHITLQADNDFYSQADALAERGLGRTSAALRSLPHYLPCPRGGCSSV